MTQTFLPSRRAAALLLAVCVAGCGDCPVYEPSDVRINDNVREATITRFNPNFTVTATDTVPDPEFSIHSFLFPSDVSSSGELPNDDRFDTFDERTTIATFDYANGTDRRTAIVSTREVNNSGIKGDILVSSVDLTSNPRTATLRVRGSLARMSPPNVTSASASVFQNYVEGKIPDLAALNTLAGSASVFGSAIGTQVTNTGIAVDIIDGSGAPVTGETLPPRIQDSVDAVTNGSQIVEVTVEIGQVYYYRAANGQQFAVLIEDIFEGGLAPNLDRMTIKFIRIDFTSSSICPAP